MQKENENIITDELRRNVQIRVSEDFLSKRIYLTMEYAGDVYVAEPIEFNFKKIDITKPDPDPTFKLDHSFANHLLKTLVEQLRQEGITTDNETKAEAQLEVTEKWLEDMRKLVFQD